MHLTNNDPKRHDFAVASDDSKAAGALGSDEIVTREMLDAGRDPISKRWLDFSGPEGFRLWDEALRETYLAMRAARPR